MINESLVAKQGTLATIETPSPNACRQVPSLHATGVRSGTLFIKNGS